MSSSVEASNLNTGVGVDARARLQWLWQACHHEIVDLEANNFNDPRLQWADFMTGRASPYDQDSLEGFYKLFMELYDLSKSVFASDTNTELKKITLRIDAWRLKIKEQNRLDHKHRDLSLIDVGIELFSDYERHLLRTGTVLVAKKG